MVLEVKMQNHCFDMQSAKRPFSGPQFFPNIRTLVLLHIEYLVIHIFQIKLPYVFVTPGYRYHYYIGIRYTCL